MGISGELPKHNILNIVPVALNAIGRRVEPGSDKASWRIRTDFAVFKYEVSVESSLKNRSLIAGATFSPGPNLLIRKAYSPPD